MLILHVIYKCKPGQREEFLKNILAEGIDAACRAEDGNLKYDYYIPTDDSGDLLLLEKWRDADALASHGKQPHMVRLRELKEEFTTDTIIEKFEASH